MKNIKREALLVPIIGLLILSYHMGYFLSDWPFWQVYAILVLALIAGRFGLKKGRRKRNLRKAKQPASKALPELACCAIGIQATQSFYGKTIKGKTP